MLPVANTVALHSISRHTFEVVAKGGGSSREIAQGPQFALRNS